MNILDLVSNAFASTKQPFISPLGSEEMRYLPNDDGSLYQIPEYMYKKRMEIVRKANRGNVNTQSMGGSQTTPKTVNGAVLGASNTTPTPTPTSIQDFTKLMEIMAQKGREKGFHPAVPVSQMAAESERGTSRRAREDNNYFGLAVYNDNSPGLRFNSPEESMDYYYRLVSQDPRYAKAYAQRATPSAYLQELLKVPYATDSKYFNMITNTPEYRQYNQ